MEEETELTKATFRALQLLQIFQELKLDELAEKLNVDKNKFKKELKRTKNFGMKKVKGETIVFLKYTGLPEGLSYQLTILWRLKDPEKIQGGSELFKKLMSIDGEKEAATFIQQLPDGRLLAIERTKINGILGLYAFLPIKREQIKLDKNEKGELELRADLTEHMHEWFSTLKDLLGVTGEWEHIGFYTIGFSNEFIKEALEKGGLIIRKIVEMS